MKKGFTLVELLAIIALLAVVMAMIVPTIIGVVESAKKDAVKSDVRSIIKEINSELVSGTVYDLEDLNIEDLQTVFHIDTRNYSLVETEMTADGLSYHFIGANEWQGFAVRGIEDNLESFTVTTPPTITLIGVDTVNLEIGGTYVEAGATARDISNLDISSRIQITNNINTSIEGTYYVNYDVEDLYGNRATTVKRTVMVYPFGYPVVTFSLNGNSTYGKTYSTVVDVTDNVAVNPSSLKYQWSTSTTQPTKESFVASFTNGQTISTPVGVSGGYYLWILAEDLTNNTTIVKSNVFNLDNTAPVITLNGSSTVNIVLGVPGVSYTDAGATATDNIGGTITSSIVTTNNVNVNSFGNYTVTYSVSDLAGNSTTAIRNVNVNQLQVEYLVIAGGGCGGFSDDNDGSGAGGGAGGYRSSVSGELSGGGSSAESPILFQRSASVSVVVGAGGSGGGNGGNSQLGSIVSIGGGGGYYGSNPGGSGSGGFRQSAGGAGTVGQGYAGGIGGTDRSGGGGGGAGAVGGVSNTNYGAAGGSGVASSINGTLTYRAGGGGSGAEQTSGDGGPGGLGGGGRGGWAMSEQIGEYVPQPGVANTGSGGGGGGRNGSGGGVGGSGIVIVRYYGPQRATGGTVTTWNGYTIHTFTTVGASTFNVNAS